MKKFILLLTSVALFNCFHSQYCVNGGPTNDEDSNVESVEIIGENNTSINYIGCPAVIGIEDQTSLYVDLNSGSSYTLDVQFGTCDDNYASVGEVWIDFNQDAIFDTSESIGSWSGTPPVSISNFTFTVPLNSVSGYSRIRVIQLEGGSLPIDPCASFQYGSVVDFTVGINTSCTSISAPFIENFDTFFPVCWVQDTTDEFDWTLNNGGTNSANTGPSDDVSGLGNYIYTEASNPRDDGDKAIVYSGSIDVSNLTSPELNFYYHMYGSAIGDLDIDLYNGNNYANIFSLSGDQGNQWIQKQILLSTGSLSLTTIKFRITVTLSSDSNGDTWPGDIAIDDFEVRESPSCPEVLYHTVNTSNSTTSSTIIDWTAGGNESAWNIEYGPLGFIQGTGTIVSFVTSNPYTLNGLNSSSSYDFYIQALCNAGNLSLWSGPYSFSTLCGAISAPYLQDFNNSFPVCWLQDSTDEFDWSLLSGATPSNQFGTGPTDDITGGGNYIYTEASDPRDQGDESVIYSDSIDISSLTNPELNFYYHMYGDDMGDLDIEIFDGSSYANIFTLSGDQGDQWYEQNLSINSTSNVVIFRLKGAIGGDYSGDIAIDNFEVREAPSCPKILLSSVNASNISSAGAELSWTAGGNETAWNIEYGPSGFTQNTGTMISVSSNPYTINGLSSSTTYDIYIQAVCSINDLSLWSAPITFTTDCNPRIAPFTENFDTIFPLCWSQEDVSDDFDWTLNDGGTNSADTGPSDDLTGGGSYMYTEASNPRDDGDFAIMYSENIDLTSLTNPMLQFHTHMYGSAIGEIQIDVFDGNNYLPIFNKIGEKGDFWEEENILIDPTLSSTKFRITGILSVDSDGDTWPGDIAIDEFRVFEAIASDLELYKGYSNSGCSLSSSEQVSILIVNKGINPQSNFSVSYKINGGAPVSEIVASTVNFEDTLNYTFNTPADLSVDGVYNFEFETQLNNDQVPSNNIFVGDEENFTSPAAALTVNDTICKGEPLSLQATSNQGLINWYSDAAGMMPLNGNIVTPPPTATTTYYAEVQGSEFYKDDFESYNFGDFIAQSSSYWTTISGNGGIQDQDDARISSSQSSSGINSVYLNEINDDNLFLLFNQDINEGIVEISMNLRIDSSANINFQNSTIPGSPEIFELRMNSGTLEFDIGTNVLTASYPGNNTWFNLKIVGDLNSLFWTIYINGVQISGANIPGANQIGLVNFTTTPGDAYYIDDVEWYVISDDDCYSSLTALTVFVEPCLSISEKINSDIQLFPNPTNGIINFTASSKIKNIEIVDFQGKIVIKEIFNSLNAEMDLEMLQKGIYFCSILTSEGSTYKKLIIQ